jgi:hypothetical protein
MSSLKDINAARVSQMRDLSKRDSNARCADCDARDPDWTSINLGIFICIKCAGIHRNLGVHHSKVRSIDLDTACWEPEQISFMESLGNLKSNAEYEAFAPCFYVRPKECDSSIIRENWIRAKYVRKEFVRDQSQAASASSSSFGDAQQHPAIFRMPEKPRMGWLLKANQKSNWQKRWFVLYGKNFIYYKEPGNHPSRLCAHRLRCHRYAARSGCMHAASWHSRSFLSCFLC